MTIDLPLGVGHQMEFCVNCGKEQGLGDRVRELPLFLLRHYHGDTNDLKAIIHYLRSQTETLSPRVWTSGTSHQTSHPSFLQFLCREVRCPRREGKVHSETKTKQNKQRNHILFPLQITCLSNVPFSVKLLTWSTERSHLT